MIETSIRRIRLVAKDAALSRRRSRVRLPYALPLHFYKRPKLGYKRLGTFSFFSLLSFCSNARTLLYSPAFLIAFLSKAFSLHRFMTATMRNRSTPYYYNCPIIRSSTPVKHHPGLCQLLTRNITTNQQKKTCWKKFERNSHV